MRTFLSMACLVLFSVTAAAQDQVSAALDVGMDAAIPGEDALLLVGLSSNGSPKIGAIRFEIVVPVKLVSFVDASERSSATTAGARVRTEVSKPTAGSDEAVLRVDVSASTPIPDGMLVALKFAVFKSTPTDREVKLKGRAATVTSVEGRVIPGSITDGAIAVAAGFDPPVSACFFYMH